MKVASDSFLTSVLRSGRWRRGSSLLEVQIAFVMLGIGLAGLCPFVVMQLRQLVNLESRFMATSYTFNSVGGGSSRQLPWPLPTYYTTSSYSASNRPAPPGSPYYYYLVPWNNPWAQKLTTRAQLLTTAGSESHSDNPQPNPQIPMSRCSRLHAPTHFGSWAGLPDA